MTTGVVYLLRNTVTDKSYVGITERKLQRRLHEHWYAAGRSLQRPINRAIAEHGKEAFVVTVLATADSLAALQLLEIYFIAALRTVESDWGYNLSVGGEGGMGSKRSDAFKERQRARVTGFRHSDEVKAILSEKAKERGVDHMIRGTLKAWADPDRRRALIAMRQRKWSPEQREKTVLARTGKSRGPYAAVTAKMAKVCGPQHRQGDNAVLRGGKLHCRACEARASQRYRART